MTRKPNQFYCQCSLRRLSGHLEVAWIPEPYARKGGFLRILRNGKWENGWEVLEVYARLDADRVLDSERLYLVQRAASDV